MSSSQEMKSVLINCERQRWKYDLIQAKQISSIATPFTIEFCRRDETGLWR